MKEAAGEANMTVITIILIGIVLAVGYGIIHSVMDSVENKSTSEIEKYDDNLGGNKNPS